jgi:glycosyltransferase involved in cell wall biosynthesis
VISLFAVCDFVVASHTAIAASLGVRETRSFFPRNVTTLHGRLDIPDFVTVHERFRDVPLISISNAQRAPIISANWQATIYHGLPEGLFRFYPDRGDYLAFLGRISPEKGADRAIEIAKRVGMPLKIAAKVDRADRRYFKRVVEPLLNDPHVEWVGEITDKQKNEFLGKAYALLFPIDWPEPFGLVMIEAIACGTPVIAYERGSVHEVMENAVTGFVVRELDQAVEATRRVRDLSRAGCREAFENVSRLVGWQMITWMCTSGWCAPMHLMPMLESLTHARKIFKRNTRNSMFRRVVFLEPASSTHWTAYIQSETQE